MFLFGNRIERLEKFIVKALAKAINAGKKIVSLYEEGSESVENFKIILDKLERVKSEIEAEYE